MFFECLKKDRIFKNVIITKITKKFTSFSATCNQTNFVLDVSLLRSNAVSNSVSDFSLDLSRSCGQEFECKFQTKFDNCSHVRERCG